MSNKRFLTGHRPKKKRDSTIGYSSLCSMKSTFPLVFGDCLLPPMPEAAGGCFSIRTTNDNKAHLKLDYEAIFDKMLVLKNKVFQHGKSNNLNRQFKQHIPPIGPDCHFLDLLTN